MQNIPASADPVIQMVILGSIKSYKSRKYTDLHREYNETRHLRGLGPGPGPAGYKSVPAGVAWDDGLYIPHYSKTRL